jgi:hypothetical protein
LDRALADAARPGVSGHPPIRLFPRQAVVLARIDQRALARMRLGHRLCGKRFALTLHDDVIGRL